MDFVRTGLAGRKISHGRYGVAEAGEILRLVRRPARRSRGHHAGRGEILELTPIVLRKRDTNNRELRRVPSVSNDAMLAASLFPAESGGTICWPLGEENAAIAAQYGDERHSVIAGSSRIRRRLVQMAATFCHNTHNRIHQSRCALGFGYDFVYPGGLCDCRSHHVGV